MEEVAAEAAAVEEEVAAEAAAHKARGSPTHVLDRPGRFQD